MRAICFRSTVCSSSDTPSNFPSRPTPQAPRSCFSRCPSLSVRLRVLVAVSSLAFPLPGVAGCEIAIAADTPRSQFAARYTEFISEAACMAYGRCLRPALYSSLRSSPSHPTGVSALRVTIAIASARFARKQWGLRKSTAKVAAAPSQ